MYTLGFMENAGEKYGSIFILMNHELFRYVKLISNSNKLCIGVTQVVVFYDGSLGPCARASYQILKLLVAHAPGMPGTFSPPQTSKETAG